ncbi:MAG: hypothetical protein PHP70_06905 [Gallionella sp.]|nr:hypothetical protein [Gallionella sp.]
MRRVILLLLVMASNSAMAEWVELGRKDELTVYTDHSTIKRAGNTVKMWKLVDYREAPVQDFTKPFKSFKVQIEFDCKEGNSRRISQSFYAGNMGKGKAVLTEKVNETWQLHSLTEAMWKIACVNK